MVSIEAGQSCGPCQRIRTQRSRLVRWKMVRLDVRLRRDAKLRELNGTIVDRREDGNVGFPCPIDSRHSSFLLLSRIFPFVAQSMERKENRRKGNRVSDTLVISLNSARSQRDDRRLLAG